MQNNVQRNKKSKIGTQHRGYILKYLGASKPMGISRISKIYYNNVAYDRDFNKLQYL
jgi:hypothetical protein